MKWLWFAASAFAFFCVVMALSTIATLSQRTTDPKSDKESEIAIMLCVYLLLWVVFAAALAESSIREVNTHASRTFQPEQSLLGRGKGLRRLGI